MANALAWLTGEALEISDPFAVSVSADLATHNTDQGYAWATPASANTLTVTAYYQSVFDSIQTGNGTTCYVNHTVSSANYQASVDVFYPNAVDGVEAAIGMRYNGGAFGGSQSMYFVDWFPDLGVSRLYRVVTGVVAQLGIDLSVSGGTHVLTVRAVGTTISGFCDGVQIASVTDTNIAAAGFVAIGAGLRSSRYGSIGGNIMTYDNLVVDLL